jgi:hypothetical protein
LCSARVAPRGTLSTLPLSARAVVIGPSSPEHSFHRATRDILNLYLLDSATLYSTHGGAIATSIQR